MPASDNVPTPITERIPDFSDEKFLVWAAEHGPDARAWWDALPDFEKIMWVLTANEIGGDALLMVEKPWKWAAEAYATFLKHQAEDA